MNPQPSASTCVVTGSVCDRPRLISLDSPPLEDLPGWSDEIGARGNLGGHGWALTEGQRDRLAAYLGGSNNAPRRFRA